MNKKDSQKEQQQEENIVKLQRLIKYVKTKKGQKVTEKERSKINKQLRTLDREIGARLPKLQRQWSSAWIEDAKGWQKLLQEKKKKE